MSSAAVNENKCTIPADEYVKQNQRMVLKNGARCVCNPAPRDGKHGDTFDLGKNTEFALVSTGGGDHERERHPGRDTGC